MKDTRKIIGHKGEEAAALYLEEKGYRIIERNFRCQIGEIDIIAEYGSQLVFVEVKSRSTQGFGLPQESVNFRKQQKLRALANIYLQNKNYKDIEVSFDVIAVIFQMGIVREISHITKAF